MSEEALEPQDDIQDELEGEELENELELENVSETEESDEFEIVYEGEEQPSSKPTVPLTKHLARVKKLTGRVDAAKEGKTEAEHRAEMLAEEVKLLQLKLEQNKPKAKPKPEDFDDDDSYDTALDEYYEAKFDARINEKITTQAQTQQTQVSQQQQEKRLETALYDHYKRADDLKVPDYAETEDAAIEILGNDVSKHIMANSSKSHELLYHLGKPANEAKALYFKNLIAENPVRGLMELGGYANKLKAKPKRSIAPDPETKVDGGVGSVKKDDLRYAKGANFT